MQLFNEDIAVLLGLHVGDGTLYKTKFGLVWELRGGLDEKELYIQKLQPLLERIFNRTLEPKYRSGGKNGCFGFQTSNKIYTNFFLFHGFLPGSKTKTVSIPQSIKTASNKIKCAFIRGLFDADGCLRFDRINNRPQHDYPKIELQSASKQLRDDVRLIVSELGFGSHIWNSTYFAICIPGISNMEKYMKEIKPNNPKFWNKYKFWKENGFYHRDLVKFIK